MAIPWRRKDRKVESHTILGSTVPTVSWSNYDRKKNNWVRTGYLGHTSRTIYHQFNLPGGSGRGIASCVRNSLHWTRKLFAIMCTPATAFQRASSFISASGPDSSAVKYVLILYHYAVDVFAFLITGALYLFHLHSMLHEIFHGCSNFKYPNMSAQIKKKRKYDTHSQERLRAHRDHLTFKCTCAATGT
jgi:hypothetical protein